ncbi:hypothetical protein [Promicromonospora umidemergens]|uniref:hypothetical protein n=1 Tax=Promicromonospora umidemergens TaxID=629679 RepID=UPI0020A57BDB|nr:hypothetical protein [Promicromonospora umidemergens]
MAPIRDGRLSGSTSAAIARVEDWPGQIHDSLQNWEREARRTNPWIRPSNGCDISGCCGAPRDDRDILEQAIHRLPRRSAQELRRLVRAIDERILSTFPARLDHYHRWWHADFPWNHG